jgi:hypothetical protein
MEFPGRAQIFHCFSLSEKPTWTNSNAAVYATVMKIRLMPIS